jgi:hypothetical protein
MASRKIEDCVPELQEKIPLIVRDFNLENAPLVLRPICTLRDTLEQQKLWWIGRYIDKAGKIVTTSKKVTNIDGVNKLSNHNPTRKTNKSRAVDFGIFLDGKYLTTPSLYDKLIPLAKKYNLVSGGTWISLKDRPHMEIKDAKKYL